MTAPTIASRVSRLEKDSDGLLQILQGHSGALQRLESKVDVIDSKVDVIDSKVDKLADDVAWIKNKLS